MSPNLTLMKTLRYCCCIILISALVSGLGILEAGADVEERILPLRRSDLVMEDGNMRSLRSNQNQIFNQETLRTLKRSSPLEILRSTVHNRGIMRSLRSTEHNGGNMRSMSSQSPWSVHTYGILRSLRSLPVVE